jgi:hypothetical protein
LQKNTLKKPSLPLYYNKNNQNIFNAFHKEKADISAFD